MFFFSVLLQIICKKVFFSDSKRWALQLDAHHEILYHFNSINTKSWQSMEFDIQKEILFYAVASQSNQRFEILGDQVA